MKSSSKNSPKYSWGFRFSPNGLHAVWMADDYRGIVVQCRAAHGDITQRRAPIFSDGALMQAGVDDHGNVAALIAGDQGYRLFHISPSHGDQVDVPLGVIRAPHCEFTQGTTAIAVAHTDGISTLWATDAQAGAPRVIATVEGVLKGGLPLEPTGRHMAFNRLKAGSQSETLRVDTSDGSVQPLVSACDERQILLAAPASGRLLFAVDLATEPRLASSVFDRTTLTVDNTHVSPFLNSIKGSLKPLAFSTNGPALYLAVNRGLRSRLILHDLVADIQEEVEIPLGVVDGPAVSTLGALRFPMTTPAQPLIAVTVPGESTSPLHIAAPRHHSVATPLDASRIELLDTPNGPVEALVQGEPWMSADRVLIALHGGPAAHWRAEYHPLLQQLVAAGITVIAVNQRGSTGYGRDHELAIHNKWGGPDLADIHDVADHLTAGRSVPEQKLMIYGSSYGAYLALLASCTQPQRWSHCVAVSPFLSGELLYREATPPVRRMMDRLGGRTGIEDDLGPREILFAARNLVARTPTWL